MAKLFKIVLTGGPCGGKTTAIPYIINHLSSLGYKAISVAEAATQLVNEGKYPHADHGLLFQSDVLKIQLKQRSQCKADSAQDTVYIYDRGMLDGKAFLNDNAVWYHLLRAEHVTEADLLSYYDAVFHMVTAAEGAEAFYTLENNAARTETAEEARALDRRIRKSWCNHPNFYIIANNGSFEDKLNKLTEKIDSFLAEHHRGN